MYPDRAGRISLIGRDPGGHSCRVRRPASRGEVCRGGGHNLRNTVIIVTRTFSLTLPSLLSFLLFGGCSDDSPVDTATATAVSPGCDANVDAPICLSADQLKLCTEGTWQFVDCDAACEQAGFEAVGCGVDPVGGSVACLCGGGSAVTGEADSESNTAGTASATTSETTGDGPECVSYGASCQVDLDCCASDVGEAVCAASAMGKFCVQTCTQDLDCTTQCCVDHSSGAKACAPIAECGGPCTSKYGTCGADSECCGYEAGEAYCLDNGDGGHCRPTCFQDDDCSQDCCHAIDNGDSVCAAPHYCANDNPFLCNNPGQSCAAHVDCCDYENDGSQCINFGGGNILCAESCILDSQCLSGCCAPTERGPNVCASAAFCRGEGPRPEPVNGVAAP